jgi:acyl-CoA thioester hydrolase
MSLTASTRIVVPFHDIDIMHIVWHGHYYKYFEIARTVLMQKLELDWPFIKDCGYAMPIVASTAKYLQGLRYNDEVLVTATAIEPHLPALVTEYEITSIDRSIRYAVGSTKQVYLKISNMQASLTVPESILQRFETAMRNEVR